MLQRVATFNIRYAANPQSENEKPWNTASCAATNNSCRRYHLTNQLKQIISSAPSESIVTFGLQEVLDSQLNDIKADLGSSWSHIGVGRDDGARRGEYNPILYRPAEIRVLANLTKWLSPTPDVPSFGWNGGSRRMVNIGVFEHIGTGRRFIHANTHLDNASAQARTEGIKVAVAAIRSVQDTWGPLPLVLTGDFNSQPGQDAYRELESFEYVRDLYYLATDDQRVGPLGNTYTGFVPGQATSRIDFIWLGSISEGSYSVQRYEIWDNVVDGVYMSDHRAVVGDVTLA